MEKETIAMTTSFDKLQDRNIAATFNVLDADQDGKISAEDFSLLSRKICEQFAIDEKSHDGRKIHEAYQACWNKLRDLDVDHDGHITMAEFAAAYKGGQGDPQEYFGESLGRPVDIVFEAMDTDQDDYISEDEYVKLLLIATKDQQTALSGFQRLDADGDGKISKAEFRAGAQQLMLSNDRSAPGTGILGQH